MTGKLYITSDLRLQDRIQQGHNLGEGNVATYISQQNSTSAGFHPSFQRIDLNESRFSAVECGTVYLNEQFAFSGMNGRLSYLPGSSVTNVEDGELIPND